MLRKADAFYAQATRAHPEVAESLQLEAAKARKLIIQSVHQPQTAVVYRGPFVKESEAIALPASLSVFSVYCPFCSGTTSHVHESSSSPGLSRLAHELYQNHPETEQLTLYYNNPFESEDVSVSKEPEPPDLTGLALKLLNVIRAAGDIMRQLPGSSATHFPLLPEALD
jgi:hypothetical protein